MVLPGLEAFIATAELTSFRAAAARLGVSPAAVSKGVSRLEDALGVRLLHRTSRHVSLTAEGEVFFDHAREALAQLDRGRMLVTQARQVAQGVLRVSLPFLLMAPVVHQLPRLAAAIPEVTFELRATDRIESFASERIDVALRLGVLHDSSLVARRLSPMRWLTCGSPAYLARRGTPRSPKDLVRHECIRFIYPSGTIGNWRYPGVVPGGGRFRFNIASGMLEAALAGLGLCFVYEHMVRDHLREGRLVSVLTEFQPPSTPLHAVCAAGQQKTPRVRAFIDFCAEVFAR